jgi:hypothetical protein
MGTGPSGPSYTNGIINIEALGAPAGYTLLGITANGGSNNVWKVSDQGNESVAGNISAGGSLTVTSGSNISGGETVATGNFSVSAGTITSSGNISSTSGGVSGSTLTSTVATGTAPLTVTSTTQVTNLNASYVDGFTLNQNVLTSSSPSFSGLTATGAASLGTTSGNVSLGNTSGTLTVLGTTTINTTGTDATSIGNSTGTLTFSGGETHNGAASFGSTLGVTGASTLTGLLTANGGETVTGTTTINGSGSSSATSIGTGTGTVSIGNTSAADTHLGNPLNLNNSGTGATNIGNSSGLITVAGTTYHNGNVGIGTSSPGGYLDIEEGGVTVDAVNNSLTSSLTITTTVANELIMIAADGCCGTPSGLAVTVDGSSATYISYVTGDSASSAIFYYTAPSAGSHTVSVNESGYSSWTLNFAVSLKNASISGYNYVTNTGSTTISQSITPGGANYYIFATAVFNSLGTYGDTMTWSGSPDNIFELASNHQNSSVEATIGGGVAQSAQAYTVTVNDSYAGASGSMMAVAIPLSGSATTAPVLVATDAGVGVGTATPKATLDVNGSLRIGKSNDSCSSGNVGTMSFDQTNGIFCVCTVSSGTYQWSDLTGGGYKNFPYAASIQSFTMPATCSNTFTIYAYGGAGGSGGGGSAGGYGAYVYATFPTESIPPGHTIEVITGGQGTNSGYPGSGGGGTFVWDATTNRLLVAAGGGGGGGGCSYGTGAGAGSATTSPTSASTSPGSAAGGSSGSGGSGGSAGTSSYGGAGGGGGWSGNGAAGANGSEGTGGGGGASALNGGAGGSAGSDGGAAGAFGGGGGSFGECGAGGGGGGYTGGGGGNGWTTNWGAGGGGGSYVDPAASNSSLSAGSNSSTGSVTVYW